LTFVVVSVRLTLLITTRKNGN